MPIRFPDAYIEEACAEFMGVLIEEHPDLPYRPVTPSLYEKQLAEHRVPVVLTLKGREGSGLENTVVTASFDAQRFGIMRKRGIRAQLAPFSGITPMEVAELEKTFVKYLTSEKVNCNYSRN